MSTLLGSQTGEFGEYKKKQDWIYTSVTTGFPQSQRVDPNIGLPNWTPAPNQYSVAKDASQNTAPRMKFGTSERDPQTQKKKRKVPPPPDIPGPSDQNLKTSMGQGPKYTMGDKKSIDWKDKNHIGPGSYAIKPTQTASTFSFGSRFDSDIRSKNHVKWKKKGGPGPGSYDMSSSMKIYQPSETNSNKTTWSKAHRDAGLKKDGIAANHYNPVLVNAGNYMYSFPKASKGDEVGEAKSSAAPGPGAYEVRKDEVNLVGKPNFGGRNENEKLDNGVPGPGQYDMDPRYPVPGFVIVPHTNKRKSDDDDDDEDKRREPVGPQKYEPAFPAHTSTGVRFGTSTRDDFQQKFFTPGPDQYELQDEYTQITNKPKFHMGIKPAPRTNKNLDTPGPGQYLQDGPFGNPTGGVAVFSSGKRSDLGIGKSHLYPGPGNYNISGGIDGAQVGFGTQPKQTRIKKTFEPGPGSYDLPTTVGHIPKYELNGQQPMPAILEKSIRSAQGSQGY